MSNSCAKSTTQLLLACARTRIDTESAAQIRELCQKDVSWESFIALAQHHRVAALVYRTLIEICPDHVPGAILNEFRASSCANASRSLFLTGQLRKLFDTFDACQIRAIAYKGPVMAASLYGNVALRQFSDLDILVHKRDYARTQECLRAQCFRLVKEFDWESSYVDTGGNVVVDLHRGLTSSFFPFRVNFESLWTRRERIKIGGFEMRHLSPEDMLGILCIQAAKDGWAGKYRLMQMCDIAELLGSHKGLNWKWVMDEARRTGTRRILLVGLSLSEQLLGSVLPDDVLHSIQSDSRVCALANQERARIFEKHSEGPGRFIDVARTHARWRERGRDKLWPYAHHVAYYVLGALTLSDADRDFLPLPNSLRALYFMIRPIRVFVKYGRLLYVRLRGAR